MDNMLHVNYRLSEPVLGIIHMMGYFTHMTNILCNTICLTV